MRLPFKENSGPQPGIPSSSAGAEIRKLKRETYCVTVCCVHNLSVPFSCPFLLGSAVYRGFWAVLMLLGVVSVVTASFLIVCAAPFANHLLYKAGGGSYIAAGTSIVKGMISSCGFSPISSYFPLLVSGVRLLVVKIC